MRTGIALLLCGLGSFGAAPAWAGAGSDYRLARPVAHVAAGESGQVRFEHHALGSLLRISAPDCARIDAEQAALVRWNRRLGREASPAKCECNARVDGSVRECHADASGLIPPEFRSQLNVVVASDGPNCWNTALRAAGLIRAFRHTTEEELRFYLGSGACRELAPGEAPEAGDLIAIRSPKGPIVHAFTFLSPEVSLTKNGYIHAQALRLSAPTAVFRDPGYRTRAGCRRVSSGAVPAHCRDSHHATYHRCSARAEAFLTRPPADAQIRLVESLIRQQESLVSDWSLYGIEARTPLDPATLGNLDESLRRELEQLKKVGTSLVKDPVERQRVQALCYVLGSLLETVHYLKGGRWSPEKHASRQTPL